VPKIYCAFTHGGYKYIAMERIEGDMWGGGLGSEKCGIQRKGTATIESDGR